MEKNISNDEMKGLLEGIDSAQAVYDFFKKLGYEQAGNRVKFFDPTYKQPIDLPKDEKEKIEQIHPVMSYGKPNGAFKAEINVFFIKTKSASASLIRALNKSFSDQTYKFLLVVTKDFNEITFVLPDNTITEEGKTKVKLTKLTVDRNDIYRTDLEVIGGLIYNGQETHRELWKAWQEAFKLEKVTEAFFTDYSQIFFDLRKSLTTQRINTKDAHEFSLQMLNRIMFIYFISKKKWLGDNPKFMRWLWHDKYKHARTINPAMKDTFYKIWLETIFFQAFNNQFSGNNHLPDDVCKILDRAPNLNGGLFKGNRLDELPVKISDDVFRRVFDFYEKYNFTIREDLPLDVEVAVDPQMIGYVYESLANVADEIYDRNDLGIFYTPKVEVEFMCRRTLVEYLSKQLPKMPKENIYKLIFDDDKEKIEKTLTKLGAWRDIEEVLDRISVVDPACGSGAFLVGMLNILTEMTKIVYRNNGRTINDFRIKKRIISRSLYGVDVMPWATHAAELRLWLQLIVETNFSLDELRKQPLLPNLDMKLRIGDSLVQEIGGFKFNVRSNSLKPYLKQKLEMLKQEKEKYSNNDTTCKFETPQEIFEEEVRLFQDIIDERLVCLENNIHSLSCEFKGRQSGLFGEVIEEKKKGQDKESTARQRIASYQDEIENLKKMKVELGKPEKKPFVWEIDFAEIFSSDRQGFDVVIGNPPYVRQEKISPPNKLKDEVELADRQAYKEKLVQSVLSRFPGLEGINRKSDLYIYFYFHGLSLLNPNGTFCFITSNSWLDVGYGADLQEFLLNNVPIHAIYDNQAKRSFEHADVNTIIALFGAPQIKKNSFDAYEENGKEKGTLSNMARFVMFKKPFEEVISSAGLIDIENAKEILRTPNYRCYPITQENLLEDGWEYPENYDSKKDARFSLGQYSGNKWGGKYLRAPDIYFTILEKGKDKLVKLSKVADVRFGIKSGVNDFFYLEPIGKHASKGYLYVRNGAGWEGEIEEDYLMPVIKNPRECDSILVEPNNLKYRIFMCHKPKSELKSTKALVYIEYGEKQKTDDGVHWHKVPSVSGRERWYDVGEWNTRPIFWIETIFDSFRVYLSKTELYESDKFYGILPKEDESMLCETLNSTLTMLQKEISGFKSLGEGALKTPVYEVKEILVPKKIDKKKILNIKRNIRTIFDECGIDPSKPIDEQEPKPLSDRKELDNLIFDAIGLNKQERKEVYWAVCELVKQRIAKAGSLSEG